MFASRYEFGVSEIQHKGVTVTTSLESSYENFLEKFNKLPSVTGRIPKLHRNRPDLISELFYGNVYSWWALMEFNNVKDPFEGFNEGNNIKIPKI